MTGPKHYWRFNVQLADGRRVQDRGWGYRKEVAREDLSRKLTKDGELDFAVFALEGPICPPYQHIHRDEREGGD
jgi:hypothetical protein